MGRDREVGRVRKRWKGEVTEGDRMDDVTLLFLLFFFNVYKLQTHYYIYIYTGYT